MNESVDAALFPECVKLEKIKDKSETCGDFLEWLRGKYILCTEHVHDKQFGCYTKSGFLVCEFHESECVPTRIDISSLLAEFFRIDLRKLELEKRRLLNEIRRGDE